MGEIACSRFVGKTALVTGGGSGFGAGIARRLALEGARVAVVDLDVEAAQSVAGKLGGGALAFEADVSSNEAVEDLAGKVLAAFGHLDVLINNAGIGHSPQPLEGLPEEQFDRIFRVNAKAVYLTSRHFVPAMKRSGGGAILNVASTGAVRPRPGLTWYNASKGWMTAATRAMAIELAPSAIRVNAINPVAGDTPLLATFMGENSEEARARMVASIPLGRLSTPEDMAAAAAYLCSDDAAMVTGIALEVDGGRCI
ncbi:MAG TPA: glucose 1-dehydrogenase [Sphingomicrobium sp.]|nr:glucose 1-dehydrogenase [Sphingomicrobium sp.]